MDKDIFKDEGEILLLEKGRRGLFHIVFGHTGIIILLLLVQIAVMAVAARFLDNYVTYVMGVADVFAGVMVLYLINRDDNPTVKLTWVIIVMVMPVFGSLLYVYIHTDLGHRMLNRRLETILLNTRTMNEPNPQLMQRLHHEKPELYNLSTYTERHGGYPIYENTEVTYFPSGAVKFTELLRQMEQAKDFIFLEYFILDEGYMWGRVLDILERKVREGVEVRVLYDGTCAVNLLPYDYPKKLRALGIQCKMFAPLRPMVTTSYNNRDHRKIAVVDGKVAFTGGVNLADEYINLRQRYGHWKDTAVMLEGEAVRSFTLMFLQMWNIDEKVEVYDRYLNCTGPKAAKGFVLPYGDSPLDDEKVGEMVYIDILSRARDYVHIMTPYLILDHEMETALTFAAKRGVEVVLIVPHIPDKKIPYSQTHSHYAQLLKAGVKIYEYTPGFVHAKVFVSDDCRAVVGTINLDYRSLYHHFECAAYMEDCPVIADIEADVQETLTQCQRITMEDVWRDKFSRKLTGKLMKLFAPLM